MTSMSPEAFRTWRRVMGLSQRQIADALGVSIGTVQNYERGYRKDTGAKVVVPDYVGYACAALYHRFGPLPPR